MTSNYIIWTDSRRNSFSSFSILVGDDVTAVKSHPRFGEITQFFLSELHVGLFFRILPSGVDNCTSHALFYPLPNKEERGNKPSASVISIGKFQIKELSKIEQSVSELNWTQIESNLCRGEKNSKLDWPMVFALFDSSIGILSFFSFFQYQNIP